MRQTVAVRPVLFVLLVVVSFAGEAPAQWARPIRFDDSAQANLAWQTARSQWDAGRISDAATSVAAILNEIPNALISVEGRGVSVEMAVSEWLRDLESDGDFRLRRSLEPRLADSDSYRWYSKQSAQRRQSRVRVFVDARLPNETDRLQVDTVLFDGDRSNDRQLRLNENGDGFDLDRLLEPAGWSATFLSGDRLNTARQLGPLRERGIEPRLAAQPVVDGDRVFVRHAFGVDAFDKRTGKRTWSHRFHSPTHRGSETASWVRRSITETRYNAPFVDDKYVALVAPNDSPEKQTTTRHSSQVVALSRTTGEVAQRFRVPGEPLCSPVEVGDLWWVPIRHGVSLAAVVFDPKSPQPLGQVPLGVLPDEGRDRPAPMYKAATTTVGQRVLVVFDEGLVACINTARLATDWVRPIGLSPSDVQIAAVPTQAERDGGAAGLLPRISQGRAKIEVRDGRVDCSSCGWSGALTLRLTDGSPILSVDDTAPSRTTLRRGFNRVEVATPNEILAIPVGDLSRLSRQLIEPTPFSFVADDGLWIQTPTALQRVDRNDLLPVFEGSRHWAKTYLPVLAFAVANPQRFILNEWLTDDPFWLDAGTCSQPVPIRSWLREQLNSFEVRLAGPPAVAWGNAVHVTSHPVEGPRGFKPWQFLSVNKLTDDGPDAVSVAVDRLRRMSLLIRVNGQAVPALRLPGRHGDDRRETKTSKAWQLGRTVVVQLGRELFGVHLNATDTTPPTWTATLAWPTVSGYPMGPRRSRFSMSSFESVETVAGVMEIDIAGRLAGNVAVTPDQVAFARNGSFVAVSTTSGSPISQRNDRGIHDILTTDGERIWVVNTADGSARVLSFDEWAAPQTRSPLNSPLVAINRVGRWTFDRSSKTLAVHRWNGDDASTWRCRDAELMNFSENAGSFLVADSNEIHLLHAKYGHHVVQKPAGIETSHIFHVETAKRFLLGVSRPIQQAGLLDTGQPRDLENRLLDGTLIGLEPKIGGSWIERWRREMPPSAVPLAQPADAPIVIAAWNAKTVGASGKLSSLQVTHIIVLDARTGETLVEDRANRPISPIVTVDSRAARVTVQLGRTAHQLTFTDD